MLSLRRLALLGVATVTLVAAPLRAAAAGKPRIAVLPLKSVGTVAADVREKMDAAVAGGLAASGADVVDGSTTRAVIKLRGIAGCETASCLATLGQSSGASHVVRGSVEVEGRSYTVRLEIFDAATGLVLERREDRCEICTEAEGYETASVCASALKAQVFKRRPTAAAAEGENVPTAAPGTPAAPLPPAAPVTDPALTAAAAAAAGAPGVQVTAPRKRDKKSLLQTRALAWVAVSVAVLALSAGITLMAVDGRGTCSPPDALDQCPRNYDTMAGGLSLTAVGVATGTVAVFAFSGRF